MELNTVHLWVSCTLTPVRERRPAGGSGCGTPVMGRTNRDLPVRVVGPRVILSPETWTMALMGIEKARPTYWLKDNRGALPSIIAVIAGAMFWAVGAIGGIEILADASSPMAMLTGLYIGLAAVAVSIIIATLALNDLARRYARTRNLREG